MSGMCPHLKLCTTCNELDTIFNTMQSICDGKNRGGKRKKNRSSIHRHVMEWPLVQWLNRHDVNSCL